MELTPNLISISLLFWELLLVSELLQKFTLGSATSHIEFLYGIIIIINFAKEEN